MRRAWLGRSSPFIIRRYSALAHNLKPASATAAVAADFLPPRRIDPYSLLASELDHLKGNLLNLLGSAHPSLSQLAQHYFAHPSKQIRSLVVLLLARATNGLGSEWEQKKWTAECDRVSGQNQVLDWSLTRPGVLNDLDPSMPEDAASFQSLFSLQSPSIVQQTPPLPSSFSPNISGPVMDSPLILPTQIRLAQLMEMIHVASCMHDQVANTAMNGTANKLAILGGDFLLGRASTALSRLGDDQVVELVATVIANIVEGSVWKAGNVGTRTIAPLTHPAQGWSTYLNSVYLASASLLAKAGRASVILGGSTESDVWKEVAYVYGLNIGFTNQLLKDVELYEADTTSVDLTAPLIYAWKDRPDLGPIIQRQFSAGGDIEQVRHAILESSGVQRTRALAISHSEKAREVLQLLPDSDAKAALDELAVCVAKRN
ncbi:hypothetical protein D9757_002258 [Collybiopsis confluens]|uniref:Uncharacterized protein n=1 Tax=Collybiopsis confluens TaxID=2823264 RepID=A0A8H5MFH8_9AGAR|nr:hypothetical protein D9757_002258 [Collybiopsis confluens]